MTRTSLRKWFHPIVPSHFRDPWGLTRRLLSSGNAAAYSAILFAGTGLVATPIDLALRGRERRRYRAAAAPRRPVVLVCGPPRSGTSLVASTLLQHLPVAYFSNWTSVFPRSPLTATRAFAWALKSRRITSRNYYGRTSRCSGPNDAMYLWDRWLGQNREGLPDRLDSEAAADMRQFFGAWEAWSQQPLLNKCNNLNAVAHLVGRELSTSVFLCLDRDPLYLAQSLYRARLDIHDDASVPYGLVDPDRPELEVDPVTSVCDQVHYFRELANRQRERLGVDRFWRVSYEQFCRDPAALIARVAREVLGETWPQGDRNGPAPFRVSERQTLDDEVFARLQAEVSKRFGGTGTVEVS